MRAPLLFAVLFLAMACENKPLSLDAGTASLDTSVGTGNPGGQSGAIAGSGQMDGAADQSMDLTGGLRFTPASHDFDDAPVNRERVPVAFTLLNEGSRSLIPQLAISDNDEFLIRDNGCQGSLAPGTACVVAVTFHPLRLGRTTGTLSASAGDIVTQATLSGRGVEFHPYPVLLSPSSLDFGEVAVGQKSAPRVLTCTADPSTGTFEQLQIVVSASNMFAIVPDQTTCRSTLRQGRSCTVAVVFAPTAVGNQSAGLVVASRGLPPGMAALSGRGIPPGKLVWTPPGLDFGNVLVGAHSGPLSARLNNPGGGVVDMVALRWDQKSGDFTFTDDCLGALAPGQSCDVTVTLTPTGRGSLAGALIATGAGSPPATLELRGQGALADEAPTVTATSEAFGEVVVGESGKTMRFSVSNKGASAVGPLAAAIAGPAAGQFVITSDTCTGAALDAGKACTLEVAFRPTTVGFGVATLTVKTPAGTTSVPLQALGTAP